MGAPNKPSERPVMMDFFGPGSNPDRRFQKTLKELLEVLEHVRALRPDGKIVLIMGSWDMLHIGHCRYIETGSNYGDFVIIGVDSNKKVGDRKGANRPVVPEEERIEQLSHLRYPNVIVLKNANDPKWHLIKAVLPDVLIATEGTYKEKELKQLEEFCGKVVVLERQAETSTSAKVRNLVMDIGEKAKNIAKIALAKAADIIGKEIQEEVEKS